jgi:hypothetical protein
MRMGRGWVLAVAAIVVGGWLGACGMDQKHKPFFHQDDEDGPAYSSKLGDPLDEDSVAALLTPDEREAVERSGMKVRHESDQDESSDPSSRPKGYADSEDSTADKAGKLSMALLTVGITLGAMAAPFFMF